jgi:hypothetical protein
LGVALSDFFETVRSNGPAIVKTRERQVIASVWSQASLEALGTIGGQAKVEAVLITLNGDGSSVAQVLLCLAHLTFDILPQPYQS